MTRAARKRSDSNLYHVVARGVSRCSIFEDDVDRRYFLGELEKMASAAGAKVLSWCLMDNHYHILVELPMDKLSQMMKALNSSYAGFFNERHERVGHLFQGRFKSEPVDSDEYLLTVVRYIHQNPERAGFDSTEAYPWSSYRDYLSDAGFVEKGLVLEMLGGVSGFVEFHRRADEIAACCDIGRSRKLIRDEDSRAMAQAILGGISLESVAGLAREQRNDAIRRLRAAHLSVRQIERLTGVSRGVISRCA